MTHSIGNVKVFYGKNKYNKTWFVFIFFIPNNIGMKCLHFYLQIFDQNSADEYSL